MNKPALSLLLLILLSSIATVHAKEDVSPAQLQQIEALQKRAEDMTFPELEPSNYHLAKSRAWLDMAMSEYYDHDNSGIISAATAQAGTLLDALAKQQTGISMDTPQQITGSETVKPELLDRIAALKRHAKFACGQRPVAQAEVYLVWAGHENAESGWSHAQSYARSVEDLLHTAQVDMDNCVETSLPAVPIALPPVQAKITLSGDALFAFNKATLNPAALSRLDELAESIRLAGDLEEVILVGHTDRMRSDGHPERNQLLSAQRAESIKQYLVGKGIAAEKIHASGAESTQPIVHCSNTMSRDRQVKCLQPNRRVEIILRAAKQQPQESGAQPVILDQP